VSAGERRGGRRGADEPRHFAQVDQVEAARTRRAEEELGLGPRGDGGRQAQSLQEWSATFRLGRGGSRFRRAAPEASLRQKHKKFGATNSRTRRTNRRESSARLWRSPNRPGRFGINERRLADGSRRGRVRWRTVDQYGDAITSRWPHPSATRSNAASLVDSCACGQILDLRASPTRVADPVAAAIRAS